MEIAGLFKKFVATVAFLFVLFLQTQAAELFLKINSPGTFEVTVNDQFQKGSTGKFRFFDLNSGLVSIQVKETGSYNTYYEGTVNIYSGKRLVAEVSQNYLSELSSGTVSDNDDFSSGNGGYQSNHYSHNNGCDESSFNEMLQILKEKSLDSQILEKAKVFAPKAHFTSSQVKRICDLMTYDSNKLEFAKFAYDYVADKGSYFVVENTFTYNSSKDDLEKYISNH